MPFALCYFFDAFSPGSPPPRPEPLPPFPGYPAQPLPPVPGYPAHPLPPFPGYPSTGPVYPPVDPGYGHPALPGYGGGYPSWGPVLPPWSGNYPSTGPVRPGGPVDPGYGRPELPSFSPGHPSLPIYFPPTRPDHGLPEGPGGMLPPLIAWIPGLGYIRLLPGVPEKPVPEPTPPPDTAEPKPV
jgi:hypothetical protein